MNCVICDRLKSKEVKLLKLETDVTLAWVSDFANLWPGSTCVVSKRHVTDQTDLFPSELQLVWHDLLCVEKAVRRVTGCDRINFVKFGNVARHLHWHVIPRYREERFPLLAPWEILYHNKELSRGEVYALPEAHQARSCGLSCSPEVLYSDISNSLASYYGQKSDGHFSTALFLRPSCASMRSAAQILPLTEVRELLRNSLEKWDCLLMQRGYGDRCWDTFGGHANAGEFPKDALAREIKEELGWELADSLEVSRQWNSGVLRGFVYLARPSSLSGQWLEDTPIHTSCQEVARIAYFPIGLLLSTVACKVSLPETHMKPAKWQVTHPTIGSCHLAPGVVPRVEALLSGETDFSV